MNAPNKLVILKQIIEGAYNYRDIDSVIRELSPDGDDLHYLVVNGYGALHEILTFFPQIKEEDLIRIIRSSKNISARKSAARHDNLTSGSIKKIIYSPNAPYELFTDLISNNNLDEKVAETFYFDKGYVVDLEREGAVGFFEAFIVRNSNTSFAYRVIFDGLKHYLHSPEESDWRNLTNRFITFYRGTVMNFWDDLKEDSTANPELLSTIDPTFKF